jgi:hypothetical protein
MQQRLKPASGIAGTQIVRTRKKTALNGNCGLPSARKTQRHKEHYTQQDIRQRRSGPKFREISHQIPAGTTDSATRTATKMSVPMKPGPLAIFSLNRGGLVGASAAMRLLHLNLQDLVEAELYETRCHVTVKASCRLFTATVSATVSAPFQHPFQHPFQRNLTYGRS